MELSTWFMFSVIALVSIISPGPAVLLSVTNGIRHGLTPSIYSSLGNITGIFFISGAAALGLGAVLQTSNLLFVIIKIVGAVYLVYLGIRQWRVRENIFINPITPADPGPRNHKLYIQGLMVAVSNPKAVLFFTALFPPFLHPSKPLPVQFFILTITFMVFSFLVLLLYAQSAQALKGWFADKKRALWFNRISGTIFIAFGLGILRLKNKTV